MKCEMTQAEVDISQALGEIWNEYIKLPKEHPMEQDEFCRAIHVCQNIVMARAACRAMKGEKQ